MPKEFIKKTLKNGLRVMMIPRPDSLATTVLVLVEAGSKYETKDINGISHFLEHMCFKGTTKRKRAIDIAGELDSIGSEYNAFTSQEWTGYYAKAQSKHNDTIVDVVTDLYLNPTLEPEEIEKEKGVVIEELNMYEDTPQRKVQDLFLELLYGDQPAGWDVGGTKEVVQSLTREKIINYRAKHYVAKATVVVISGNFDQKEMLQRLEGHFRNISTDKKFGKLKTVESQAKPNILLRYKESDQTHIVLGTRAFDVFDKRKYALEILADVLGGGMSSRLFQRVRERLGAAYYVRAGADLFTDHGVFSVSAGVDHRKLEQVLKAILEELQHVAEGELTEKELTSAKDHLSGRMLLGLETSDALAMFYGGQEILERTMHEPKDVAKAIAKVKKSEVIAVARDIFRNNKLNLALIGPFKDKSVFEKILHF